MNIFILCAGKGTRFESIYPKPLNLINGKPMIYYTIKSLKLQLVSNYNLYIIYNKKLDNCNFKEILINMFPELKFNFILIDYFTRGSSESAYIGLKKVYDVIDNDNIIFIDNDTIYPDETYKYLNKRFTNNFIFTNFNVEKDPIYSYVSIDKDNQIIDIKEKQKISDLIGIGLYGFKNKYIFCNTFESILKDNSKTNNEFYISLIYEYLLKNSYIVENITIDKTISLGTPHQLINTNKINTTKLRYVFDLDNTLVTYPTINKDYSSVKPIEKMINLVRKLKNDGHTIIIYTARRMGTHSHNIGAVTKDIGKVTFDTLDKFNIPYDELVFGKPLGDIYIDDRAYNPYDERLYKLIGEYQLINDIIDNKIENNKYNEIKCIDEILLKQVDKDIGKGELYFYENLELLGECNKYFVKYFGYIINDYSRMEIKMEKINGIPLSYLYINETYSIKLFEKLLNSLKEIHSIKKNNIIMLDEYKYNYLLKIKKRFENKEIYNFKDADLIYKTLIEKLQDYIERIEKNIVSVIHGDFWFSNILLTYKDDYKFIDMKGLINNNKSISGDKVYDYAKILQSLIGFDAILYDKEINNEYNKIFIDYFKNWLKINDPNILFEDVQNICALLIFGSFHAYTNMEIEKKNKIIELVKKIIELSLSNS
jgi:capsule biosynthesis phosphatase